MKYKNKETGAVIDVQSEMGGAWEPVKEKKPKAGKETGADQKPEE